mmetsp:Transcript_24007/g.83300  ORF Transcript_24007/g.83300 Transcript_24007/m.83300 type:complete len:348 (-) Transcript_24007:217-1260(-)
MAEASFVAEATALAVLAAAALYLIAFMLCANCRHWMQDRHPAFFELYLAVFFWPFVRVRRCCSEPCWRRQHAGEALVVSISDRTVRADVARRPKAPAASTALLVSGRDGGGAAAAVAAGAGAGAPLRIVVVSDTHGATSSLRLPAGDVLLHCGDILTEDRGVGAGRGGVKRLRAFNEWLGRQPFAHRVVIAGNHDATCDDLGVDATRAILTNATYLCDSGVVLSNGLRVYGSPVSVGGTANCAFQEASHRDAAERVVGGIAAWADARDGGPDVVMLHGPPSRELRAELAAAPRTRAVVFGHLHNGYGLSRVVEGDGAGATATAFVNAAVVDGAYAALHRPIVLEMRL